MRLSFSFLRVRVSSVSWLISWQVGLSLFAMQFRGLSAFCLMLFSEDYYVDVSSEVFFGAAYFGAVAYWRDFAFKETSYAVNC